MCKDCYILRCSIFHFVNIKIKIIQSDDLNCIYFVLNYVALKPITEVRDFLEVGALINSQYWLDTAIGAFYQYKFCMCYSKEHRMAVISKWSNNTYG